VKIVSVLLIFFFYSSSVFSQNKTAVFAGGCFWCMEEAFEAVDGVDKVVSGYTGGTTKNPNYEQVTNQNTGHYEAVLISYNPQKISYAQLLDIFWKNVDPYDDEGQFCDKGPSYLSAIFYSNDEEKLLVEDSVKRLTQINTKLISTKFIKLDIFYLAEGYHQDYYKRNPLKYNYYKTSCGRVKRLKEVWK
jgi:peptide-methionine (S)-S-oxide reductase